MKRGTIFPQPIAHGLNAVEYLRDSLLAGDLTRYHSGIEIASAIGTTPAFLARTLMVLGRAEVVDVRRGPGGGFRVNFDTLKHARVVEVLRYLGQPIVESSGRRGIDRLNNTVHDALDISLEEFLE
jgi:DNA-binding IscR family transcriptional regulator